MKRTTVYYTLEHVGSLIELIDTTHLVLKSLPETLLGPEVCSAESVADYIKTTFKRLTDEAVDGKTNEMAVGHLKELRVFQALLLLILAQQVQ